MHARSFTTLTLFALIFTHAVPVFSQQPAPSRSPSTAQDETIRVGTSAVQVEAIVTDKSGKRINGLRAADFVVLDEGAPQELDFFSAIEGARVRQASKDDSTSGVGGVESKMKAGTSVSPLATPYQGRHIALVVDDLNLAPENLLRARRAFADYINAKLTSSDLMALISTGGSLASLQQFTSDKQRLLSALNRIGAQTSLAEKTGRARYNMTPTEAVRIDSGDTVTLERVKQRIRVEEPDAPIGSIAEQSQVGRPGSSKAGSELSEKDSLDSGVRAAARAMVSQINQHTRITLKTMENLFRGMADLPGRKVVVLLTESLLTAGGTTGDVSNDLVQLIEVARRSGVSVYALDAAGLRANNVTASERTTATGLQQRTVNPELTFSDFEKLGAARTLVAGTGGDFINNTNDLAAGLDRAIEDSNNYYVVGFKPRALDNKFHRLTVSIKGQPDLVVRSRRGYLAVNQETAPGTDTELAAALISAVPRLDLPLEAVTNVVPKAGEQVVFVGLHVGRNYLTLPAATATEQTAAYDVLAWVFAAGRDQPVGVIKRTLTYDLAKDLAARQKLKSEGFVLVSQPLQLPPGKYQVRAVVREKATAQVGSAYQFFEVPNVADAKEVSLSSIVLTAPGQAGFNGYYNFKHGTEVEMRYVIYNLPKDVKGLAQRVRLLDYYGRLLMDSELPLAAPAGGDVRQAPQGTRVTMPPSRGHYALIISLRDVKEKVDVERRADFVVE